MNTFTHTLIIGAGIVGCSTAYYLAKFGVKDVLVIDKGPLFENDGSTSHAPGGINPLSNNRAMQQLAAGSIELFENLPRWRPNRKPFHMPGGIDVARSDERIDEIKRLATNAKTFGIETHTIGPQEIREMLPFMDADNFNRGLYVPRKATISGADVCGALAAEAEKTGNIRFVGDTLACDFIAPERPNGTKHIEQVITTNPKLGTIHCERVLLCTNIWTPALSAMLGIKLPLMAAEHQYLKSSPLPSLAQFNDHNNAEYELVYPTVRDLDGGLYYRHWWDSLGIGSYHHKPIMVDSRNLGTAAEHRFTEEDWVEAEKIAQASFPELKQPEVTYPYKINGMFSFTVDGMPVMGETSVDGLWIAAAIWVTNSGGAGKAMAEWLTYGESSVDLRGMDVNRFLDHQKTQRFIQLACAKSYAEVHDVSHPAQPPGKPRNVRYTPFHQRHIELDAYFTASAGLEIPYWLEANVPLVEKYRDQIPQRTGWAAQHWSPIQAAEHLAMRDGVGMFDLTALSIIEVEGPDATRFMNYLCTGQMDIKVGKVVYTLLCTPKGGIKRDVTVVRKSDNLYWIFTGNGTLPAEMDWLYRRGGHLRVRLSEKSRTWAAIGLFGPHARQVLEQVTLNDVSNNKFPFYTWQEMEIGLSPLYAMRISYVGELGWEFHMPMDCALAVRDTLWEAGQEFGLVQCGVGAMRSMRVEKGYRVWGSDIHTEYNPYEAGMGWMVKLDKRDNFLGKEALQECQPERRLITITIDDPNAIPTGNEPIFSCDGADETVIGHITSGDYGYSVGSYIGFGYLPLAYTKLGTPLVVEYMGQRYSAVVAEDCLFDPC